MNQYEFELVFKNFIGRVYDHSGKRYPQPVLDRLFEHAKPLEMADFKEVADIVYDTCQWGPTVKELVPIIKSVRNSRRVTKKIECRFCLDTGITLITTCPSKPKPAEIPEDAIFTLICDCGAPPNRKEVIHKYLPKYEANYVRIIRGSCKDIDMATRGT